MNSRHKLSRTMTEELNLRSIFIGSRPSGSSRSKLRPMELASYVRWS